MKRKPRQAGRPQTAAPAPTVGIPWYTPEEWSKVRAAANQTDDLGASFDDWLAHAEQAVQRATKSGYQVVKVDMDAEEFATWCRERGQSPGVSARAHFVAHKLDQQHRAEQKAAEAARRDDDDEE